MLGSSHSIYHRGLYNPTKHPSSVLLNPTNLSQQLDLSKRPLPPQNHTPRHISPPHTLRPYVFTQRAIGPDESPECTAMDVCGEERRGEREETGG